MDRESYAGSHDRTHSLTRRGLPQQKGAGVAIGGGVGARELRVRHVGAVAVDGVAATGLVEDAAYPETEMGMRCDSFDRESSTASRAMSYLPTRQRMSLDSFHLLLDIPAMRDRCRS